MLTRKRACQGGRTQGRLRVRQRLHVCVQIQQYSSCERSVPLADDETGDGMQIRIQTQSWLRRTSLPASVPPVLRRPGWIAVGRRRRRAPPDDGRCTAHREAIHNVSGNGRVVAQCWSSPTQLHVRDGICVDRHLQCMKTYGTSQHITFMTVQDQERPSYQTRLHGLCERECHDSARKHMGTEQRPG